MRLVLAVLLISGCISNHCYPEANYPNYTQYETPDGGLDPIDARILSRVEACLAPLREKWLSLEEAREAECYGTPTLLIRSCLRVAVAPDWRKSACTEEEVFPCAVPIVSCTEKGLTPTEQCPCACRAMIQDETTIWVTPNRKLLAANAVTLLTGCNRPWTESLAVCSNIRPE